LDRWKNKSKFEEIIGISIDYDNNITFGNNMQFSISQSSGIINGFKKQGWVKGKINNTNVKVSIKIEYALNNFFLHECIYNTEKLKILTKNRYRKKISNKNVSSNIIAHYF